MTPAAPAAPAAVARAAGTRSQRRGGSARSVRRAGVRTLLLAVLALAAVVAVRPPHAPPLYDGLGQPDEPYRWAGLPPSGVTSVSDKAPTALTLTVDLAATAASSGWTAETGPQLAIQIAPKAASAPGGLTAPAGSSSVKLVATPEAAPAPPPGGSVVSNLYRWKATADRPGPVTVTPGSDVFINLRAESATDQYAVIERWDGKAWAQLATRQVGVDIYAARIADLDPVAVVKLDRGLQPSLPASAMDSTASPAAQPVQGSSNSPQAGLGSGPGAGLWIGFGAVLALLAGGVLLARRRARAAPVDPTSVPPPDGGPAAGPAPDGPGGGPAADGQSPGPDGRT